MRCDEFAMRRLLPFTSRGMQLADGTLGSESIALKPDAGMIDAFFIGGARMSRRGWERNVAKRRHHAMAGRGSHYIDAQQTREFKFGFFKREAVRFLEIDRG